MVTSKGGSGKSEIGVFDVVVEGVDDTVVSGVLIEGLVDVLAVLDAADTGRVTGVVVFDVVVEGVVDVVNSGEIAVDRERVDCSEVLTIVEGEVGVPSDVYAEDVTCVVIFVVVVEGVVDVVKGLVDVGGVLDIVLPDVICADTVDKK